MTVKYGEMDGLVTPIISIDEYKPKIGEVHDTVVVAFEVKFEQAAHDLSNLLETDVTENLDVDISQGPGKDGTYIVFIEFKRDQELIDKILSITKTVSNVTSKTKWKFNYYKGEKALPLSKENLIKFVITDKKEYKSRFSPRPEDEDEISRMRSLAGINQ